MTFELVINNLIKNSHWSSVVDFCHSDLLYAYVLSYLPVDCR